jgi:uncharacterized glyoxalase superfamily protein PhnB
LYLQTLSKRDYLFVEDADALYAEYAAQGVEFTRGLGNMPWHKREFVVKDCDGRLLAFGANLQRPGFSPAAMETRLEAETAEIMPH